MNLASWIILVILIVVILAAIIVIFKNKGKGCSCCVKKDSCPYCKKNR